MPPIKFSSGIDLQKVGTIINGGWEVRNAAPSSPVEGQQYYDSTKKQVGIYNGTSWDYMSVGGVSSVNGETGAVTLDYSDVGALADTTTISDLTTTTQQDAIDSGANSTNIGQIATNTSSISTINGKIPSAASSSNQLADKQYVDNAVQTNSAHFRGNWSTWTNVPTDANDYPADDDGNKTPTTNDYMVVQDASGYTGETLVGAWQFTYTGLWSTNGKSGWLPRFQINESALTPTQQAALDSGANSTNIAQIGTNTTDIGNLQTAVATKAKCFSTLNTALTESGGVCTWSITNSVGSKDVIVAVYLESTGERVNTYYEVGTSTITVKINATANIAANTYRAVVVGLVPNV